MFFVGGVTEEAPPTQKKERKENGKKLVYGKQQMEAFRVGGASGDASHNPLRSGLGVGDGVQGRSRCERQQADGAMVLEVVGLA